MGLERVAEEQAETGPHVETRETLPSTRILLPEALVDTGRGQGRLATHSGLSSPSNCSLPPQPPSEGCPRDTRVPLPPATQPQRPEKGAGRPAEARRGVMTAPFATGQQPRVSSTSTPAPPGSPHTDRWKTCLTPEKGVTPGGQSRDAPGGRKAGSGAGRDPCPHSSSSEHVQTMRQVRRTPRAVTGGRGPPGSGRTSGRVQPPRRAGKPRPRAHLDATLARQLHGRVVVATAQQVLHHHAVHALPLPHAGRCRLVAAVLLEVLDPALA